MSDRDDNGALKAAELLSTAGAAVLGAGLALLWPRFGNFAIPLIAVGLVGHAAGMVLKHWLQRGQPQPGWSHTLVWLCWLAMAVLMAGLGWRVMNG